MFVQDVTSSHSAIIPYVFPEARDLKFAPALYAACRRNAPHAVLGVALLSSPAGSEDPAFRFGLEVFEHSEELLVSALLLQHLIETASMLRAPSLRNIQPVRTEAGRALMDRFGFALLRQTVAHEFPLDRLFEIFERQIISLQSSGRIPSGILSGPYSDGEENEISALCRKEFGALTYGHLEAIGEHPAGEKDYSYSRAFRLDGILLGALGVALKNGDATFDPLLIAPGRRNTWVFTYVIHSVLKQLVELGIERGRAQIHQDNLKMMALMNRIRAQAVGIDALYQLELMNLQEESLP